MATLSAAEVKDFWALGLSLEATVVPDDEWLEALVSSRVQYVFSNSSMGSAETGWKRATTLETPRSLSVVVPPGQIAEDWSWDELRDDRDDVAVCWAPFWSHQQAIACRHLKASLMAAFDAECRRLLTSLQGQSNELPEGAPRAAWDHLMARAAGPKQDHWGHGDLVRQGAVRLALLRFVVRLVRSSR